MAESPSSPLLANHYFMDASSSSSSLTPLLDLTDWIQPPQMITRSQALSDPDVEFFELTDNSPPMLMPPPSYDFDGDFEVSEDESQELSVQSFTADNSSVPIVQTDSNEDQFWVTMYDNLMEQAKGLDKQSDDLHRQGYVLSDRAEELRDMAKACADDDVTSKLDIRHALVHWRDEKSTEVGENAEHYQTLTLTLSREEIELQKGAERHNPISGEAVLTSEPGDKRESLFPMNVKNTKGHKPVFRAISAGKGKNPPSDGHLVIKTNEHVLHKSTQITIIAERSSKKQCTLIERKVRQCIALKVLSKSMDSAHAFNKISTLYKACGYMVYTLLH